MADYFASEFYQRQKQFTGDEEQGLVLFDAMEFRTYLNSFFCAGTTRLKNPEGDVHWVFDTPGKCYTLNSCAMYQQPYWLPPTWDSHCTIFSLYYEVKLSPLCLPVGNLKSLDLKNFDECQYVDNIIILYEMLYMLFTFQPFISYANAFPPWISFGNWAESLAPVASAQVSYLNNFKDELIAGGKCKDPYSGYETCAFCDDDEYVTCVESDDSDS